MSTIGCQFWAQAVVADEKQTKIRSSRLQRILSRTGISAAPSATTIGPSTSRFHANDEALRLQRRCAEDRGARVRFRLWGSLHNGLKRERRSCFDPVSGELRFPDIPLARELRNGPFGEVADTVDQVLLIVPFMPLG
jgi:hypothetical protein